LAGLACVLLLGLGGVVGCSAYPTLKDVPVNCSVEDPYDFDSLVTNFHCYQDGTPDAGAMGSAVNGEGVCGSTSAQVLIGFHNNDWGSSCGTDNFGPLDRSNDEGLSFWARAPDNTSKGFTISFYDANNAENVPGGHCKVYNATDGGIGGSTINAAIDPATGQVVSGSAIASRLPDECGNNHGNGYDFVMSVTSEWAFYTIPWDRFTQWAYPNRVPNSVLSAGSVPGTGLLTTELWSLGVRAPKEAPYQIWIDKLGFYRKKTAGVDAAASPVGSDSATAGAGGSSGSTQTDGVQCPVLTGALITDFTDTSADGGAADSTTLAVGEHVYPTSGQYMVTSDVTQNNWHLSGTLGDYSGFGLDLINCSRIDASAYRGIQFTISGSVSAPSASIVTLGVGTLNNAISSDWLSSHGGSSGGPGRCLPKSGTNQYDQPDCKDAKKDIPVTALPTVQRVLWTDFTGGNPEPGVTPTDIISIYWYFPNPTGVGTAAVVPYHADIVIDDLQFITP
jgi:hypothetical protein